VKFTSPIPLLARKTFPFQSNHGGMREIFTPEV